MKEGRWVQFHLGKQEMTGWIEEINGSLVKVRVDERRTYNKFVTDLTVLEPELTETDKRELLDLALLIKDKQWFESLAKEIAS